MSDSVPDGSVSSQYCAQCGGLLSQTWVGNVAVTTTTTMLTATAFVENDHAPIKINYAVNSTTAAVPLPAFKWCQCGGGTIGL